VRFRAESSTGTRCAKATSPENGSRAERLGHAEPGFTLSTYTRVVPGAQEAAAQAIGEEVFGKTAKDKA
jgi:hypothetical protein